MTTITFYYSDTTRLDPGTGKPRKYRPHRKIVCHAGEVTLRKTGAFIAGRNIGNCMILHGEIPRVIYDTLPEGFERIRATPRLRAKLPPTYIDHTGNIVEGATGRIIFRA